MTVPCRFEWSPLDSIHSDPLCATHGQKRAWICDPGLAALKATVEETARMIEQVKVAFRYAGIGTPYPDNRLERLLQDKAASSTNADDGMFWRAVCQRLKAALSPTLEPHDN